ncbi:hypothetical protein [Streptomyces axinellae]|uniref:Uncharacterized protein n=1 Tax=Streptomyces axinellae TaxID=552788 RepID=A0ABN3QZ30_9ACTN
MHFEVLLRFETGGPAVTGVWEDKDTALRKHREQLRLYGGDSHVLELVEVTDDGERHLLKAWPPNQPQE